jgi:flagellar P-ring protein FlgI
MIRITTTLVLCMVGVAAHAGVRIKDIASLEGVRDNQLVGYGLVVGLSGSGDTLRNSTFTGQSLKSMLDKMGVSVNANALRTRNVAAVMVTADMPPFVNRGSRIDVTVSALGDSTSLMGGTLIMTPLAGPDGVTHAVAQGAIAVTGFASSGQAETVTQGVPTVGRVPEGALIERELPTRMSDIRNLILELKNPDFKTAVLIADAINEYTSRHYGVRVAREQDYRSVAFFLPAKRETSRFMAEIGDLTVEPDTPARVIIDSRTGTVVIGQDVQISTVAVTHGNLTVRITETPTASQPNAFSRGTTVVTPITQVEINQAGSQVAIVGGTTLRTLVRGLNQIGLKPPGIIAILQAIKSAGALQADLIAQ